MGHSEPHAIDVELRVGKTLADQRPDLAREPLDSIDVRWVLEAADRHKIASCAEAVLIIVAVAQGVRVRFGRGLVTEEGGERELLCRDCAGGREWP